MELLPQAYRKSVSEGITDTEEIKKQMFKILTATSGNYEINGKVQFVAGISLRNEFATALINQFDFESAGDAYLRNLNMQTEELVGQSLGR